MRGKMTTSGPGFLALFTPKLVTVLREHYHVRDLKADLVAGLTVAIVALPLSMAIAIASGVTPEAIAIAIDKGRATIATVRPATRSALRSASR